MLLVKLDVGITPAEIVVVTDHRAPWVSGCHPPSVQGGTSINCTLLPTSWTILEYRETLQAQVSVMMLKGF